MAEEKLTAADGPEDLGPKPEPFAPEPFASNHVCLIYDGDGERERLVAQYLATGLRQGERVRYFTDTTPLDEVRRWLAESGVDLAEAEARGAFGVVDAATAYYPGGVFDPIEVITRISVGYEMAYLAGYTGTRSTGEMSWVRRAFPGSELFLEYERRLNAISTPYRHNGMCQYDARLFDGAALFKVLQVHPFMLAQGQIVRNPCYRRPEEPD